MNDPRSACLECKTKMTSDFRASILKPLSPLSNILCTYANTQHSDMPLNLVCMFSSLDYSLAINLILALVQKWRKILQWKSFTLSYSYCLTVKSVYGWLLTERVQPNEITLLLYCYSNTAACIGIVYELRIPKKPLKRYCQWLVVDLSTLNDDTWLTTFPTCSSYSHLRVGEKGQ